MTSQAIFCCTSIRCFWWHQYFRIVMARYTSNSYWSLKDHLFKLPFLSLKNGLSNMLSAMKLLTQHWWYCILLSIQCSTHSLICPGNHSYGQNYEIMGFPYDSFYKFISQKYIINVLEEIIIIILYTARLIAVAIVNIIFI